MNRFGSIDAPFHDQTYIVDFAVILNEESVDVMIIEINKYAETTGAGLFDWKEDIGVLTGQKPFEFRVTGPNDIFGINFRYCLEDEQIVLRNEVKELIQKQVMKK